jgi:hypothetical protein
MLVDPATRLTLFNELGAFDSRVIVSYVKAFGTTLGGDYIESNTFGFKITACLGCLILFSSLTPTPNCTGPALTTTGSLCYVGEDVAFDCHRCVGEEPICTCGQKAACP